MSKVGSGVKKLELFDYRSLDYMGEREINFTFGLLVSDVNIDIILICRDPWHCFSEQAPNICLEILAKYRPDKRPHDIDWSYTVGGGHSDMAFDHCNGVATTMTFTNGSVLNSYCYPYKAEEYNSALNDPRGLTSSSP